MKANNRGNFSGLLTTSALLLAGSLSAYSATDILSITTSTTTASSSVSESYTFENTTIAVSSFTTSGTTYEAAVLANESYVRRVTTGSTANHSSVWYTRSGSTDLLGIHETDYPTLLLSNDITGGSDNTFANGTSNQEGNIERLDFVYSSGLVAASSSGFAVFDRGAITAHDGFKIAVITAWDDTTNEPLSYGTLVGQLGGWGPSNVTATFDYRLFRYDAGDDISTNTANNETGSQGIGGLFISFADLNIANGTTIFGYSLFGFDVTDGGTPSNLIDWTDSNFFPTNTTGGTGSGGIDLATANGVAYNAVPEPSTFAFFSASMIAAALLRRRRRP